LFSGQPGSHSEEAHEEAGDGEVCVEGFPVEAEARAGHLDGGEVGVGGFGQALEGAGREGEAAAVGEVDGHPAARGVLAGGGGAGLGAVGGRAVAAGGGEVGVGETERAGHALEIT
jgi:hypothetical protein